MTGNWMVEAVCCQPTERDFKALYLGEYPRRTEAQAEAEQRLKHRGREDVLRFLCREIDRETDPARQKHLRSVRLAVFER